MISEPGAPTRVDATKIRSFLQKHQNSSSKIRNLSIDGGNQIDILFSL